jgi:predicted kinase
MIIVVFGLPATGKTLFATRLAEEISAIYLNTETIKENLNLPGKNDSDTINLVYDQLVFELATQVQYNHNVVLDGVFPQEAIRKRFVEKARKHEKDIWFIEIKADDQTVKDRLIHNASEVGYDLYLQLRLSFENLGQPHLILWSDRHDQDEMIQLAKDHIRQV